MEFAAVFGQVAAQMDPAPFWLGTGIAALLMAVLFFTAFRQMQHARLLQDTPTSRIRSAAQGYVKLQGHARLLPGPEIFSPLSGARCCWWSYKVERQETVTRNGKRSTEWVTVEAETSGELFLIADETGDCIVDPQGATVHPSLRRSWRGRTRRPERLPQGRSWLQFGEYRYTEQLLQFGDWICAMGQFRSQGLQQDFDEAADLRELLAEWKRDQQDLLQRFDADASGHIDAQEWEAVRRAALVQVRSQQVQRSLDPEVHVLGHCRNGRPFLLSTLDESQLLRRHRWTVALALPAALGLGVLLAMALQARGFSF